MARMKPKPRKATWKRFSVCVRTKFSCRQLKKIMLEQLSIRYDGTFEVLLIAEPFQTKAAQVEDLGER